MDVLKGVVPLLLMVSTALSCFASGGVEKVAQEVTCCDLCGGNKLAEKATHDASLEWGYVWDYYAAHPENDVPFAAIPRKFHWLCCPDCQLAMVSPRLNDNVVMRFYDEYFSGKYKGFVHDYDSNFREGIFSYYMSLIEKHYTKKSKGEERFLDVGCADGVFMKLAKEKGFVCYGNDVTDLSQKEASRYGEVIRCDAIDYFHRFEDGFFDVIAMVDTLEHFRSPSAILEALKGKIRPGGLLFLETPDFDANFEGDRMSRHFHLFNKASMKFFLEKNGFTVEEFAKDRSGRYNPGDVKVDDRFLVVIARKK
ncbi:MAG: class I SAM-dependent methyltransferase [Verrucomicrobiota bacterium]|nr:MAG: class I SAM-dependent methyltransferase [Verrucomicrobiota bacterium]